MSTSQTAPSEITLDDIRIPSLTQLVNLKKAKTIREIPRAELKEEYEGKAANGKDIAVQIWFNKPHPREKFYLTVRAKYLPDGKFTTIGKLYTV